MKALTEKILHYAVLIGVTIFAISVLAFLLTKNDVDSNVAEVSPRKLTPVVAVKSLVEIEPIQVQMCELYSTFSGKIRAWETYQIAFEVPGRVKSCGSNDLGQHLDVGDDVSKGQVLAVLDDRVYRAQVAEAQARLAQAISDVKRAQEARASAFSAVTDAEMSSLETSQALAQAQYEVAVKNLEDATVRSPVDATVSKRMVKAGESVTAHQMVFELVERGDVLLVVDVPEYRIRELEIRMREVLQNRAQRVQNPSLPEETFRAHVRLEGRDRFGNPWPPLLGEVYQIGEVADPRTGLFEVEVRVPNEKGLLRPGMVATADLVTNRIAGYQIPQEAVIYRGSKAHLFTVEPEQAEMEMLYWNLGQTQLSRARRVDLQRWADQGPHVIIPANEADLNSVVVRGQLRLADSQVVRIKNPPQPSPGETQQTESAERVDVSLGRSQP